MSASLDAVAMARYIDGRLPEADRHVVEAHLRECEACRVWCAKARQLIGGGGGD